jgi:ATP-dependent Clp protease protease subunit
MTNIANIVQAQLLFLESADAQGHQIYLNSPGGSVYAGLEFASFGTRCIKQM